MWCGERERGADMSLCCVAALVAGATAGAAVDLDSMSVEVERMVMVVGFCLFRATTAP